MISFYDLIW